MEAFRGWDSYDWGSLNHNEVVSLLKTIITTKYKLRTRKFNKEMRKEAHIARRNGRKPLYYVAHIPDIVMMAGNKQEDRIFIEYVHTLGRNLQNLAS